MSAIKSNEEVRALGAMERLFWLMDQNHPAHLTGWPVVLKTSESIWRYPMFAFIGYHLDQNRSAINHDCLRSTEPFLHQKQIGLCNVMSFADSPHR